MLGRVTTGHTIKPLDESTWDAYADMMGRNGGGFMGCWCTWFHPHVPERGVTAEGNRDYKKRLVEEGRAHAALVFDGDEAVAWANFGTPDELPTMKHAKGYDATTTVLPDYRIVCVYVDRKHRGLGLSRIAIQGALDMIAAAGGGVVESYPRDTGGVKIGRAASLENSTREVLEEAGFTYDRPKGQFNCVMKRTVDPSESQ
jgi:GNAT superfamily N-acetyltransferase